MMLSQASIAHDPWEVMQQPAHPSQSLSPRYRALLAALDQGWIIQDIQLVHADDRGLLSPMYHILLHRLPKNQPRVMLTPANQDIEALLKRNGFG
jgi:hypothetical protein